MADYLFLTISKRSGFCQRYHFCTEARRWHEWNLSCGHRMTYLAATTRVIWRPPDNYFAAARELFWWPPYNTSGDRYIILLGMDPPPPPGIFKIYISENNIFKKRFSALPRGIFVCAFQNFMLLYLNIMKVHVQSLPLDNFADCLGNIKVVHRSYTFCICTEQPYPWVLDIYSSTLPPLLKVLKYRCG